MVNQDQWNKKALDYIYEQREKALSCTICGKKLFTFDECLDEFVKKNHRKIMVSPELEKGIFYFVYNNYTYVIEDGSLHRHHTNYRKGITIPVCGFCHQKIHKSNDPKYTKYLPVDSRPKDHSKIVYNLYDTKNLS